MALLMPVEYSQLKRLRERIAKATGEQGIQSVLTRLSEVAYELVMDGFMAQRDPYGRAWKKRKDDSYHPILDKTGDGIRSIRVRVTGNRTIKFSGKDYMNFHVHGTRNMVARPWRPVVMLGGKWRRPFERAVVDEVKKNLEVKE